MKRFISRLERVPGAVTRRLVIENDDRNYTLGDCIKISRETGIPVLFDLFHHEANNLGETVGEAFNLFYGTWKNNDGIPMVDYSSPRAEGRKGSHAESIDLKRFSEFLEETGSYDFDIMLEIKDKEQSALRAEHLLRTDERFKRLN